MGDFSRHQPTIKKVLRLWPRRSEKFYEKNKDATTIEKNSIFAFGLGVIDITDRPTRRRKAHIRHPATCELHPTQGVQL